MALAMVYPDSGEGGRGKKDEGNLQLSGKFSKERLRQARTVLHYSRKLAEAVLQKLLIRSLAARVATLKNFESVLSFAHGQHFRLAILRHL